jgi:hypothetical protein
VFAKNSYRRFRRGEWVRIRSEADIRATLDAEGKLEGLPFMPEQAKFCGRRFRIYRRADRVYLDHHYFVVRLKDSILLDKLRCDGAEHGGCQMNCLMFWKEAWLEAVEGPSEEEKYPAQILLVSLTPSPLAPLPPNLRSVPGEGRYEPAKIGEIFFCQATELAKIGKRLSGWDLRQYAGDVLDGERNAGEVLQLLAKQARNKLSRLFSRRKAEPRSGTGSKSSAESLNLQAGEWVEVKSLAEINETLSSDNRLRGLGFSPDMIPFCGKRFRVSGRVERIILEWTGELKQLRDTVALEMVHCDGSSCRGCPRNCFFLWREGWLKRVEESQRPA